MEVKVMSCKENSFVDKKGTTVSGYMVAVSLGGSRGWIECWSNEEMVEGEIARLDILEGKWHKPKVKLSKVY